MAVGRCTASIAADTTPCDTTPCDAVVAHAATITCIHVFQYLIYKDNYGRLNMIGRERANRSLIGCDNQ